MLDTEAATSLVSTKPGRAQCSALEGNGCIERLIRTLKEQLLWLRPFRIVEELRLALHEWRQRYNTMWLIERHGFLTPEQARREHEPMRSAA